MKKIQILLASTASIILSLSAHGAIYEYETGPGIFGQESHNASYDKISTSYDGATEELTWEVQGAQKDGYGNMDGFWLVINAGGNPKSADVNELAIFYADVNAEKLWVYAYNGLNNSNSWMNPGIFLGDYSSNLTIDGDTVGFELDASAINAFEDDAITTANQANGGTWNGAQFFDSVGIWFHPVWNLTSSTLDLTEINDLSACPPSLDTSCEEFLDSLDGRLTEFDYEKSSWFDIAHHDTVTNEVPVPASIVFFGSALLSVFGITRRASKTSASA